MYSSRNFWEWILNYCGYKYVEEENLYAKKLEDFLLIVAIANLTCFVTIVANNYIYTYETKSESLFQLEAEAEDKYEIAKLNNV